MSDPVDRDRYLGELTARLDLPEHVASEVIEEVTGHIDDGAAELRAQGAAPEDAERRAIRNLGDARELGVSLSRARRDRRWLLAAAGGGVRGIVVDGGRLAVLLVVAAVLAGLLIAVAFILLVGPGAVPRGFDRATLSWVLARLSPWPSLWIVALEMAIAVYLGRVLPARVARSAGRSVRGVRPLVAGVGVVLGSAFVWTVPSLGLDPILAVGDPLIPVAFGVAALAAPDRPRVRPGVRAFLAVVAVAAALTAAQLAAVGIVSGGHSVVTDFSSVGEPAEAIGLSVEAVEAHSWPADTGSTATALERVTTVFGSGADFATLRIEVWPVEERDGVVRAGAAPLAVTVAPAEPAAAVHWSMPHPRSQVPVATFVVGITPDGRRIVLPDGFEPVDLGATPPWRGTLAGFWFGD